MTRSESDKGSAGGAPATGEAEDGGSADVLRIEELERHLAAIVNSSDEAIFSKTLEGTITSWNPGGERLYGYSAPEIVGQSVSILVPEARRGEEKELLARIAAGERIDHYETQRVRKDGTVVDVSVVISGLKDASGAITGASVIARDITESKRLRDALHEARDEAQRANLAKSEFLSRMSHELRTPLNAILGFAQLLEMDDLTPEQSDSVGQIIKGGRHLLELINEVLDISRVETGQLRLSLEPVRVSEVVYGSIDLIRPLAGERNIQLGAEMPSTVLEQHVVADRQRLGQALLNLLSNGVKYNAEGGAVTVTGRPASGGLVRIGVSDTGPGLAPEKLPLVFTPFERLGAEETSVEGTGLGLALSKSLVEAMGGQILVDTMMGQGTTFWVELKATSPTAAEEPDEPAAKVLQPASLGTQQVLYIEDNLSNLKLIERLLARRPGIELMSAMTATLGLDLAFQHVPDLILLDLHLPDLRGDEVLLRLAKDPRTSHIPVVILSAEATPGEIKRLMAAGATDYLTKPLDVKAFMRVLDQSLESEPSDA